MSFLLFCLAVLAGVLVVEMLFRPLRLLLGGFRTEAGVVGKTRPPPRGECKMVMCVRSDLGMGKGKIAAQCGHAVIGAYRHASKQDKGLLENWSRHGEAKVVLKLPGEREMFDLCAKVKRAGLSY
eukprot:GHVS01087376.1.p1 GENE.GHVS01087376.1~~GHVS01087376.1.p1  ORF type:complete len:125 (-),score=16.66 GHVS01087376.1:239-613(-)